MRYRVFGNDAAVEPAPLLEHLHTAGFEPTVSFRADARGWFEADMLLPGEDEAVKLERFLAAEEGVRTELHTWIAWLETRESPHQDRLIRLFVSAAQVFTLTLPDDTAGRQGKFCLTTCRYLAGRTRGVYQIDGQGLFATDGGLLVPED